MARKDIYIPDELNDRLCVLDPRSISRICRNALQLAVEEKETLLKEAIDDALDED